jgi:hypothetical protein
MEIPTSVYALIGFLIFSNFSTLITLVVFIFKIGKFVANTEHGIEDAKGCAVRAHKRIDHIEGLSFSSEEEK